MSVLARLSIHTVRIEGGVTGDLEIKLHVKDSSDGY